MEKLDVYERLGLFECMLNKVGIDDTIAYFDKAVALIEKHSEPEQADSENTETTDA